MNPSVLSVTQLNMYVKGVLESDIHLKSFYISGEISNFTNHYKSGHFYLTLKDDKAAVKAVMFRSAAQYVKFVPENGMKVICRGRVSLFERDGSYQLYIEEMQPDGVGALQVAYEQLKAKLEKLGMFDESIKKPIPRFPSRVAVITSPTGAAVQDIKNVITRRCPLTELVMCPVLVQGESAAPSLISAVNKVNELDCADVIIIGRGGGSIEDLWAFNSENLAYAIYSSHIPVISAVGHETDFTICDFVSDLRAPTPSAAAELAVPDVTELSAYLASCKARIKSAEAAIIGSFSARLDAVSSARALKYPGSYIDLLSERVDSSEMKMLNAFNKQIKGFYSDFAVCAAKLDALSPLKTISRGYSIAFDSNDNLVRNIRQLSVGDTVTVKLCDGNAECTVDNISPEVQ